MSNRITKTNHYAYLGPLGEIVRHGRTFFARKDGFLVATYSTFYEAMASISINRARTLKLLPPVSLFDHE
jgi:hypothetical protein